MSIIIRHVRPGDIPALIDLASETFLDSFGHYHTPENCRMFIEHSHNEAIYEAAIKAPSELLLIAEHESELLSYLYAKPTTLPIEETLKGANELSKIYSRKSAQSRGLGTQLLKAWEAWAAKENLKNLALGV